MFFKCAGRVNGNRFIWKNTISSLDGAVTSLGVTDMNGDGKAGRRVRHAEEHEPGPAQVPP